MHTAAQSCDFALPLIVFICVCACLSGNLSLTPRTNEPFFFHLMFFSALLNLNSEHPLSLVLSRIPQATKAGITYSLSL